MPAPCSGVCDGRAQLTSTRRFSSFLVRLWIFFYYLNQNHRNQLLKQKSIGFDNSAVENEGNKVSDGSFPQIWWLNLVLVLVVWALLSYCWVTCPPWALGPAASGLRGLPFCGVSGLPKGLKSHPGFGFVLFPNPGMLLGSLGRASHPEKALLGLKGLIKHCIQVILVK